MVVACLPYSRRIEAVSWITSGLAGEPSIGRKAGATVTKFTVAEACIWESGVHPVVPAGGDVAGIHVTDTLAGTMFAELRTWLSRASAWVLSKP
jgi:hypothetical protein